MSAIACLQHLTTMADGEQYLRVSISASWSKDKGHEEEEVPVGVLVDYDGTVKTPHVITGDPVLGDVSENAVKQWQFHPFMLHGEPIQMESQIVMKFSTEHAEVVVGER